MWDRLSTRWMMAVEKRNLSHCSRNSQHLLVLSRDVATVSFLLSSRRSVAIWALWLGVLSWERWERIPQQKWTGGTLHCAKQTLACVLLRAFITHELMSLLSEGWVIWPDDDLHYSKSLFLIGTHAFLEFRKYKKYKSPTSVFDLQMCLGAHDNTY